MIRQHYLQQQRLQENHARLLDRYQRLVEPTASQFQTFGTSPLPGRNYEQMFQMMGGNKHYDGMSLANLSRNGIGTTNEAYQWTVHRNPESLPNNVASGMQHHRRHFPPLVQADKFEPVQMYEHPVFGPTPAYIKPITDDKHDGVSLSDLHSDRDETESLSSFNGERSKAVSSIIPPTKDPSTNPGDRRDAENSDSEAPPGYISYKKWKAKYENLIPVDPLMYNIYTRRPNGSVHRYGQSMYNAYTRPHQRQYMDPDPGRLSPTLSDSDTDSIGSEQPIRNTSVASKRQYHKLEPKLFSKPKASSLIGYVPPDELKDLSDDDNSLPDLPSLSISRPGPMSTASNPMPAAGPLLATTTTGNTFSTGSVINATPTANNNAALNPTIPSAPPLPPSLLSTSSGPTYQTPVSLSNNAQNPVPSLTGNSSATYQTPSSVAVNNPSTEAKVVSFDSNPGAATTVNNRDLSSSSDSDDDAETRKRKRRKKRQAAGLPDDDSSSSDD